MSRDRAGKGPDYQDYAVGSAQVNDTVTLGLGWLIDPLGQDEAKVGDPKVREMRDEERGNELNWWL